MKDMNFSVSMCVYGKDNSKWFDRALESITIDQSLKPNEIVLVVDGPISQELECVINKYSNVCKDLSIDFKIIRFEINQGHGNARRASVENTTNDLIALMDADDVCSKDRFEKQIQLFSNDKIDCAGGNISEFIGDENNVVSFRNVPDTDEKIKIYAKSRCPMNQMTVMFRKNVYNISGGYIDWYQDEDYYLWLRMMKNNAVFANSSDILVNVRVGEDMYKRRGGYKYYQSEKKLQKYMLNEHFISYPQFIVNVMKRFVVQVLLPNRIRGWVFKKFARSKLCVISTK